MTDSMYRAIQAHTKRIKQQRDKLAKKLAKMKKRTKRTTVLITFVSGYQVGISGRPDVILREILKMDLSIIESIDKIDMTIPSNS